MSNYIIAGIILLLCISVIIFGVSVLKDTRSIQSEQLKKDDKNFSHFRKS
ncbi:MAG TPA: hypothetical protein PKC72_04310 [Chitinophagaceae bacterium]|nr:hypothetical protein [Chitinophagaceae bacterium]